MTDTAANYGDVLSYFAKTTGASTDTTQRLFEELKRFLVLCRASLQPEVASEDVDELWHTFLLFTESYKRLCYDMTAGFVDHRPVNGELPSGYLATRRKLLEEGSGDIGLWPDRERAKWSVGLWRAG